jgi:aspartate/methionine/tyrosine aminotransferase
MRNFELETYFSQWEFTAKHHMTASDVESMSMQDLLDMGTEEDRCSVNELWLGYTETWGAPDLRQEIAKTYDKLAPENILCMAGAGEGIYAGMRALLNKGDHVIVIVPNYQSAETVPLEICQVTGVELKHENDWQLDIDDIKAAIRPNTTLISINFPHNPTGALLSKSTLNALIEVCREHDLYLFSDEVYRGVEIDPADTMSQIADVYEKGISLNVLSKAYGLPALRVGWLASQDQEALQKIERYKHYLSICNSGPSERLAIIALKNQQKIFARNRNIIKNNLAELNQFFSNYPTLFDWQPSQGGCVAFPRYIGPDGVEQFCKSLIEESGVLLLPASLYKSELMATPVDNFRIGFGRGEIFKNGLKAMRDHIETKYSDHITTNRSAQIK